MRQPGAFVSASLLSVLIVTCNLGLEGASDNMVRSTVFDGNEIVPWGHWCVCDPVALRTFNTVHLDLGGPINGHG